MNTLTQKVYNHRRLTFSLILIIGLFFYAFWSLFATRGIVTVPKEFSDARVKSDTIAAEFVSLSETTQNNLQKIKDLDNQGKTDVALANIRAEISRGDDLKIKGTELLSSLSQMTYSLGGISPEDARAAAYDAIKHRIEMVNSLVSYSSDLEQILHLLTTKVLYGDNIQNALQEKISAANNDARSINDLNAKFNNAMKKLENY